MMKNQGKPENILRMSKHLKSTQGPLSSVYVKKNKASSEEKIARLRLREREEKAKPEKKTSVNIVYE